MGTGSELSRVCESRYGFQLGACPHLCGVHLGKAHCALPSQVDFPNGTLHVTSRTSFCRGVFVFLDDRAPSRRPFCAVKLLKDAETAYDCESRPIIGILS